MNNRHSSLFSPFSSFPGSPVISCVTSCESESWEQSLWSRERESRIRESGARQRQRQRRRDTHTMDAFGSTKDPHNEHKERLAKKKGLKSPGVHAVGKHMHTQGDWVQGHDECRIRPSASSSSSSRRSSFSLFFFADEDDANDDDSLVGRPMMMMMMDSSRAGGQLIHPPLRLVFKTGTRLSVGRWGRDDGGVESGRRDQGYTLERDRETGREGASVRV